MQRKDPKMGLFHEKMYEEHMQITVYVGKASNRQHYSRNLAIFFSFVNVKDSLEKD